MISVVIPAFNEEKRISACLDGLVRQTYRGAFEVIVVDNNSTDRTRAVLSKYRKMLPLRVITEKKKGRGAARKAGFAAAKGDIILSTDADSIVPPDWIAAFVKAMRTKDVVAITGITHTCDCSPLQNAICNITAAMLPSLTTILFGHPGLGGYSFAIRRTAYMEAGGFNADADAYEDLELATRVHKIGKISHLSDCKVEASGRRFKGGMLKGTTEYWMTFLAKFVLKKKRVPLSVVQ